MPDLTAVFAHLCGQRSCLVAGGEALCVCQRCLGLYVGAALTAVWLAVGGLWRRGLPSWSVFLVQEAFLLAAMLGGVHAWNGGGPTWKIACGLWTGHVLVVWMVGGAGHLRRLSRRGPAPQRPWRRRDKLQALAAPPLLALLAVAIPRAMSLGHAFWSALIVLGAAAFLTALTAAGIAVLCFVLSPLRAARSPAAPP